MGRIILLRMVATDGHRLALAKGFTSESSLKIGKGIIIPRKGLMEIKRIIDENEDIQIGLHKNMFVVKTENTLLKLVWLMRITLIIKKLFLRKKELALLWKENLSCMPKKNECCIF